MNYRESPETEFDRGCPTLLEAASPDLYRKNAFRVTGLTVEATPRDISRHAEKLKMIRKYSSDKQVKMPLALDPPPDEYSIRTALHNLQDPEKRLIDEFFWFWPAQLGQGMTDSALVALGREDLRTAVKVWAQLEKSSESYVSIHNLAVMYHCLALDWEFTSLNRQLTEEERKTAWEYWEYAVQRWRIVIEHEPFWSRLAARIRALEDPRLTTGLARRMRDCILQAFLSINATLAVRFAEQGKIEEARRQVKVMSIGEKPKREDKLQSGSRPQQALDSSITNFLGPIALTALRHALSPLRQRLKSICQDTEDQVDRDPMHGDRALIQMIENTKPLLRVFDCLLPSGDTTRDAVHDEVAGCILRNQFTFGNQTKNWKAVHELLEHALSIAIGEVARQRIQENLDAIKSNLLYCTCWFCKSNPADESSNLAVPMYGNVKRTPTWNGTHVTWQRGTVTVPRCATCSSSHNTEVTMTALGWIVGIALGVCGFLIASAEKAEGVGCVWLIFLVGGGYLAGKLLVRYQRPQGVQPKSMRREFPSVKELLRQGWQIGSGPG